MLNHLTTETINECYKMPHDMPIGYENCARFLRYSEQHYRHDKAKQQSELPKTDINKIIEYVNIFLSEEGFLPIAKPTFLNPLPLNKSAYSEFLVLNKVNNHIGEIFIKLTSDGYIGVVGKDFNDINFSIPTQKSDYTRGGYRNWVFNTSGILLHNLGKTWNQAFVLLFPLSPISSDIPLKSINEYERAIGNFLSKNNVPIIDFYSHNYDYKYN